MNFNKKPFATVATLAITSFGTLAHADVIQRTSALGSFTMDNAKAINVTVQVSKYIPTVGNAQTSGTVLIAGVSGSVNASITAQASSISFSQITVNGTNYDQAHIVTQNFVFVDLKTSQRTLAFAQLDVTKMGKGMICFQVFAASDHHLLSQTCDGQGNLYNVPMITGSALISAPAVPAAQ